MLRRCHCASFAKSYMASRHPREFSGLYGGAVDSAAGAGDEDVAAHFCDQLTVAVTAAVGGIVVNPLPWLDLIEDRFGVSRCRRAALHGQDLSPSRLPIKLNRIILLFVRQRIV